MTYKAIYLPVAKEWTDGCVYIDINGENNIWDAESPNAEKIKATGKVAELFLVTYEYNRMEVVGKPCKAALKWVKPGMEFRRHDIKYNAIDLHETNDMPILNVVCERCGSISSRVAGKIIAPE